jgi:uncharacterized pyridoxamine 5'-phosphate oxidase family protein
MLKENEYIIERLEQLDKTYSIIKSIVTDDTFRTLKKMYYKKYPGILNIFRVDTADLTIIKPVKENTTIINNMKFYMKKGVKYFMTSVFSLFFSSSKIFILFNNSSIYFYYKYIFI